MTSTTEADGSIPQWIQNDAWGTSDYFGPIQFVDISEVEVPLGSVPVGVSLYEKGNRVGLQLRVLNLQSGTTSLVQNTNWGDYVNAETYCDSRTQTCPQNIADSSKNKVIASVATVRFINRFGLTVSWQDSDGGRYNNDYVPPNFVDDGQYFVSGAAAVSGLYCDTNEVSNFGAYLTGISFYQKGGNRLAVQGLFQKF